jgi:glycosyltransferase involved in cell wall biosynthesis
MSDVGAPFSLTVPEVLGLGPILGPTVGTTHGGRPEILDDGVTAVFAVPGDEAALAKALVRPCRGLEPLAAIGARASTLVAKRFACWVPAAQLAANYDELASTTPCQN